MFPNHQKKHLVAICSQGHVLCPNKPMFLLSFLWSVVCKWTVINVILLTLKIPTQNTWLLDISHSSYPTNFEKSNTEYKTNGIFSHIINAIILALHV